MAYRAAQQAQQYQPYAQEYMRYAPQFRAWLAAQQQALQAQQAQQQTWWQAPEYNPDWLNQVVRDPVTNELRVLPGRDPAILAKLHAANEHRAGFLDRFAFDPIAAIKPGIAEVAREVAAQMIQENLGQYQDRSFSNNWVSQNSTWLHARDPQGMLQRDPQTGAPMLSGAGQRFAGYVGALENAGVSNVQAQQALAERLVRGEQALAILAQAMQGQQAQNTGDAQKQAFLAAAAQQAGQGLPANYGTAAAQPGAAPRMKNTNDLFRAMLGTFAQAGVQPGAVLDITPPR
jgi:hypothetical protein